jgi:glycopeptide antibiotics resistance protein
VTRTSPLPRRPKTSCLVALFGLYLLLLAWIVLWKLGLPWIGVLRAIKLVPFAASGDAGPSEPSEVLANLVLFVPFGVYLCLLAPSWRWWKVAGVATGTSLLLEVTQYVLGIGSSDITDVIMNAAGTLAGFGLLALVRQRLQARTATVMTWVCSIGTILAVVVSGIFVTAPLRWGPPGGTMTAPHIMP